MVLLGQGESSVECLDNIQMLMITRKVPVVSWLIQDWIP